jgi:hypothetical protein
MTSKHSAFICFLFNLLFPALVMPGHSLSQDIGMLFENKNFSDVILSASGCELHAHKAVLAARSPVFAVNVQT